MSELPDSYDGAAVSGQVRQPPFTELVHRSRRRVHRTRTVRLAGVAVVAGLAAVPLMTLPGEGGVGNPAFPGVTPPAASPDLGYSWGGELSFFDLDHLVVTYVGYIESHGRCEMVLSVTDDGGASWSEWRVPPALPGPAAGEEVGCYLPPVAQVAPATLVLPIDSGLASWYRTAGEDPPTTSFISFDAGRTWQAYEPQLRTAETVPAGVVPTVDCVGWTEETCTEAMYWYDPQTGDQMVLANPPPAVAEGLPGHSNNVAVATDGSIWVTGLDADGDYRVSVSRDQGRNWLDQSPTSVDVDDRRYGAVVTYDGETGYFYWVLATEAPGPIQLFRTTDGGETWQPAELPLNASPEGLWAIQDGLVATGEGGPVRLGDDGETLADLELNLPVTYVRPVPGGFLSQGFTDLTGLDHLAGALSPDGLTWHGLQLPGPDWPPVPTP